MSNVVAIENGAAVEPAPKRIALIGSAPSSVALAPYGDPSWTIWGCSPGAVPHVKRIDAWFEMHPLPQPDILPDYLAWMAQLDRPIYMVDAVEGLPKSVTYPRAEMEARYGPYFFTSTLSWMFAMALEQHPQEIGLWGVDMAATEEYGLQRPGCHYFVMLAKERGIKITVPPESDLLKPPAAYGYVMGSPMYKKLMTRKSELEGRLQKSAEAYEANRNEWNFLKGALDDLNYTLNTWVQ